MQIRGPFSYSGNKYRVYSRYLKPYLNHFKKIHEPFCGSAVCLYNSESGGIGIDNDSNVIQLHNSLLDEELVEKMKNEYFHFFPTGKRNAIGYNQLRDKFNDNWIKDGLNKKNIHLFHLLIQLGFNSLIRFGPFGFNVPFGRREVDFDRIEIHQKIRKDKDILFKLGNYNELKLDFNPDEEVIYLDPPYVASNYQYNGWNKEEEIKLLLHLDEINLCGFKFILSNTFLHRKKENKELIEWSKKYNVIPIKMSYNAWSAAVKGVKYETNTIEVIIKNF